MYRCKNFNLKQAAQGLMGRGGRGVYGPTGPSHWIRHCQWNQCLKPDYVICKAKLSRIVSCVTAKVANTSQVIVLRFA